MQIKVGLEFLTGLVSCFAKFADNAFFVCFIHCARWLIHFRLGSLRLKLLIIILLKWTVSNLILRHVASKSFCSSCKSIITVWMMMMMMMALIEAALRVKISNTEMPMADLGIIFSNLYYFAIFVHTKLFLGERYCEKADFLGRLCNINSRLTPIRWQHKNILAFICYLHRLLV